MHRCRPRTYTRRKGPNPVGKKNGQNGWGVRERTGIRRERGETMPLVFCHLLHRSTNFLDTPNYGPCRPERQPSLQPFSVSIIIRRTRRRLFVVINKDRSRCFLLAIQRGSYCIGTCLIHLLYAKVTGVWSLVGRGDWKPTHERACCWGDGCFRHQCVVIVQGFRAFVIGVVLVLASSTVILNGLLSFLDTIQVSVAKISHFFLIPRGYGFF